MATIIETTGNNVSIGSGPWWLGRLEERLDERAARLRHYEDYYVGRHNLNFATKKFREAFGPLFADFADNFTALVVDATEERLNVEGFRIGGDQDVGADQDAWRIWQANQLDAESQLAHVEALVKGVVYVHVSPFKDDWTAGDTPLIVAEDPLNMIVETGGANRRVRRAALKRWVDDSGYVFANVYLPDRIEKYQSEREVPKDFFSTRPLVGPVKWLKRSVAGEDWPLANPIDVIPIIPMVNRPRIGNGGVSEIHEIIPIQDAINKVLADMLLASEFAAFGQKYLLNFELERDPVTGKPIEPFKLAVDRLMVVPPPVQGEAEPKFGEFSPTPLEPYVAAAEMLIQHAASISRTPPHYLLGQSGSFPSGESLKATETGLVAKAHRKMRTFGETWEEVIRISFLCLGDERANVIDSETIWRDPESRTEAEHIDALTKLASLGVPKEQLWEDAGYTPQQIERFKAMRAEEAALTVAVPPTPPSPPGA